MAEPKQEQSADPHNDTHSAILETQEIFFCRKPDECVFQDLFKSNGIASPFSSYNIKTKLKVKAIHLIEKLLAKVRQVEAKGPDSEKIKALKITSKDIKLYFYCSEGNRWWFESRQKISDMIEASKWPRDSLALNSQQADGKNQRNIYFVVSKEFK